MITFGVFMCVFWGMVVAVIGVIVTVVNGCLFINEVQAQRWRNVVGRLLMVHVGLATVFGAGWMLHWIKGV